VTIAPFCEIDGAASCLQVLLQSSSCSANWVLLDAGVDAISVADSEGPEGCGAALLSEAPCDRASPAAPPHAVAHRAAANIPGARLMVLMS